MTTRAQQAALAVFLPIAFSAISYADDEATAARIKALEAEKQRLLSQIAEIDAKIQHLKGNAAFNVLPPPLNRITMNSDTFEDDIDLKVTRVAFGEAGDAGYRAIVWTLKATERLRSKDVSDFLAIRKLVTFYDKDKSVVDQAWFNFPPIIEFAPENGEFIGRNETIKIWIPMDRKVTQKLLDKGAVVAVIKGRI